MKPRQPFPGFAICAMSGVFAADCFSAWCVSIWPWAVALAAVAFACARWRSGFGRRAAVLLAVAALFFAWHAFRQAKSHERELALLVPPQGRAVRAVGVVAEEPAASERSLKGRIAWTRPFRVRLESLELDGAPIPNSAVVFTDWPGPPPLYGDRVELLGSLRNVPPPRNPGEFDFRAMRLRQGVYSEIRLRYPRDARVLDHGHGNSLVALSISARRWMERTLSLGLDASSPTAALIRSMALGSRSESLDDLAPLFQETGSIHLFTVTGMNIAMLALAAAWLLPFFRAPRRAVAAISLVLVWAYCFVTGLGPSSLRAAAMITVVLVGVLADRPALPWNSLGFAVVAVLFCDPNQLFKPGFVFSFGVVAVLLFGARRLHDFLNRWGEPDPFLPRRLWSAWLVAWLGMKSEILAAFSLSLVAWAASVPLLLWYFHIWSPVSILANLIGGALAWLVVNVAFASVLAGTASAFLASLFNQINWLLAKCLLWVVAECAALPGGFRYLRAPAWPFGARAPVCVVESLDLAGGGATHLHASAAGGRDWLIDCGSASAFSRTVAPYLHASGVNRLDGFIATHGDSQHLGGALELLETMPPGEAIDSALADRSSHRQAWHDAMAAGRIGKSLVQRGDKLTLAPGIALHVLFPPAGLAARNADDKALVLRLDVEGGPRILFTSDSGFNTEHWLLDHADANELRCEILVKGMHASDLCATPEFLEAVRPRLVVTSGADFPPPERVKASWTRMLARHGIQLLRQDKSGGVRIVVDAAGGWKAAGFLDR